jgi:glutathione synthase
MSSSVRLVVIMDPIEAIKPAKDSTLAMLLAAQARGWHLFYAEQKDLWLRDGVAWGRLAPLQVLDDLGSWFVRGRAQTAKLGEFDVILMRKDPPFDTEYIYTT